MKVSSRQGAGGGALKDTESTALSARVCAALRAGDAQAPRSLSAPEDARGVQSLFPNPARLERVPPALFRLPCGRPVQWFPSLTLGRSLWPQDPPPPPPHSAHRCPGWWPDARLLVRDPRESVLRFSSVAISSRGGPCKTFCAAVTWRLLDYTFLSEESQGRSFLTGPLWVSTHHLRFPEPTTDC